MTETKFDENQIRDTQGLVFSGYNKVMKYCSYYLLKIEDPGKARAWLKTLSKEKRITNGGHRGTKWCLNLAFSYNGLINIQQIGRPNDSFEMAFRDGMDSERRSVVLGDQGENKPQKWHWGNKDEPVDILLMLYAQNKIIYEDRKNYEESAFNSSGVRLIKKLDTLPIQDYPSTKEHFGFVDGVSDPLVEGFPKTEKEPISTNPQAPRTIPTGEFLLGYPNGYDGKITTIPSLGSREDKFGQNGTYLVFRQLEQDVEGFWSFINAEASVQNINPEYLASKFVGRWKSGAVILPGEIKDSNNIFNEFDFRDDPKGLGCPFGSHIRRSNPRGTGLGETVEESLTVANRHRILRRGRSYGDFLDNPLNNAKGQDRGLFFICLNANIERQFEFIQNTWINNIKFHELYEEDDPIIGSYNSDKPNFPRSFTIQDEPLRRRIYNFKQYVTLRGGGYFFLPGIKGLEMLGV